MHPVQKRSAVIVAVPEAAGVVDRWKEETCRDKPSTGVPAHITLVFPFAPAETIDDGLIASLEDAVGAFPAFEYELAHTARFPDTLYLAPDPAARFAELTQAIVRRFPDFPPYAGAFDEIVPHLTVAVGGRAVLDAADDDLAPHLPIAAEAREAVLLEEVEPDWGRWEVRAFLPLSRATRTRR